MIKLFSILILITSLYENINKVTHQICLYQKYIIRVLPGIYGMDVKKALSILNMRTAHKEGGKRDRKYVLWI